jgi:hypothetical protein
MRLWFHLRRLDSRLQKSPINTPEETNQEMDLKVQHTLGLKLSNFKPRCRVSALHFFMK